MSNKTIIVLTKGESLETWGSLSEICRVKDWSYNYLKKKKFPFEYKGWKFRKRDFRKEDKS